MTATEVRKRHERAKEQGRAARRAGHKQDRNPYRGASVRTEHNSWLEGWNEADMERRAKR